MNFLKRFISSVSLIPLIIFIIYNGKWYFNFLIFLILTLGLMEIFKLKIFKLKLLILFLFLLFVFFSYKIIYLDKGNFLFLGLLLISWLSDVGGYVFGKLIGGKKIKIISPNKTYSGFFGSIIFSQLSIFYFQIFDLEHYNHYYLNSIFLIFCSIIVIFGDLFFSYCKRLCEIKDYSNIIPGHGGLLDRIDGLIFLIIFYYLFFTL